jgi:myb proto-oncogene protein
VEGCAALHQLKAEWSEGEFGILELGIMEQIFEDGPWKWNSLAEALPGRTAEQCREEWTSMMSQKFTQGRWTVYEDAMLRTLQRKQPNQSDEFTGWLPGRSADDIRERWVELKSRDESGHLRFVVSPAIDPRPAVTVRRGVEEEKEEPSKAATKEEEEEEKKEEKPNKAMIEEEEEEEQERNQAVIDEKPSKTERKQIEDDGGAGKRSQAEEGGRNAPDNRWLSWIVIVIVIAFLLVVPWFAWKLLGPAPSTRPTAE